MEIEEQAGSKKNEKLRAIERVTIEDCFKDKLLNLTSQGNAALEGMALITKSDVINFILSSHSGAFTRLEIKALKSMHFDEVKFAQWITVQLKTAKANGEAVTIADLLSKNPGLVESANGPLAAKRNLRKSKAVESINNSALMPPSD